MPASASLLTLIERDLDCDWLRHALADSAFDPLCERDRLCDWLAAIDFFDCDFDLLWLMLCEADCERLRTAEIESARLADRERLKD